MPVWTAIWKCSNDANPGITSEVLAYWMRKDVVFLDPEELKSGDAESYGVQWVHYGK